MFRIFMQLRDVMTLKNSPETAAERATQRLVTLLERLGNEGISQAQVAARGGMPSQYLSDVKKGRRPLTELFARRLANEYNIDYLWLLGVKDSPQRPDLTSAPSRGGSVWLPVFSHPIEGDPRTNPKWDGTSVEVSSVAAARLANAVQPYVLRFGHDDKEGRLRKGDLVLISQSPNEAAELLVVRSRNKSFLARNKKGKWYRAATGQELRGEWAVTGHCLGIVWSALCK
jgi:hypothetical protein